MIRHKDLWGSSRWESAAVSSGAVNILERLLRIIVNHEVETAVVVSGSGLLAFDKALKFGHSFCHLTNKDETHPRRAQG